MVRPVSGGRCKALDLGRLHALGTVFGFILDGLVLLQRLKAFALDNGVMDEYVLTAVLGRNKPETLLIVEPLDLTRGHVSHSFPNGGRTLHRGVRRYRGRPRFESRVARVRQHRHLRIPPSPSRTE